MIGGYIPITSKITLALTMKVGEVIQLTSGSKTYPDRLFYIGGFDSMRGWSQDAFIPQDVIDAIEDPTNKAKLDTDPTKISPRTIPIRGGNLMINPRIELRLPVTGPFETVVFGDFGNLWRDASYIFTAAAWDKRPFPLRVAIGSGIRVQTPVGPLALDYGINLTRLAYEDFGALNFSVGLF
jgi:outer membrane protein assembly factor BamA